MEEKLMSLLDNSPLAVMDAEFTKDDEIIITLDYNVNNGGFEVSNWNTNGSNVFIFN